MAQYNPTSLVGQLKGSIGSTTFQGGNRSSVIRHRGYKKGSSSNARNGATSRLVSITTLWRSLTDIQRTAWANAALLYPFVNKFGATYFASAYQCFVAYNSILVLRNLTPVLLPVAPATPTNLSPFTMPIITTTSMKVGWAALPLSNTFIYFYGSAPVSAGRNNNNPKLRFLGAFNAIGSSVVDIIALYNFVFGDILVGQRIIIRCYTLDENYSFKYFPTTISTIVS